MEVGKWRGFMEAEPQNSLSLYLARLVAANEKSWRLAPNSAIIPSRCDNWNKPWLDDSAHAKTRACVKYVTR